MSEMKKIAESIEKAVEALSEELDKRPISAERVTALVYTITELRSIDYRF